MSEYSPAGVQVTGTGARRLACGPRMDVGHGSRAPRRARPERDRRRGAAASGHLPRAAAARGRAAAGALHARGVGAGAAWRSTLAPGAPFVEALHGCLLLGARRGAGRPAAAARASGRALLRDARSSSTRPLRGRRAAPGCPPPPGAGDTALVVHTSGTTGGPSRSSSATATCCANARGVRAALGPRATTSAGCARCRSSHVGGLMVLLRSRDLWPPPSCSPPPFDAEATAAQLGDGGITVASLVPTQLRGCSTPAREPGPRCGGCCSAAAPMPRALLARARDAGFPVCPTYGLTQACSQVTVAEPGDLETAGRALPGVGVAIAADGEILVAGPTVDRRRRAAHRATSAALDDRGRLVVTGRKGDTIVTGGENVAPAEVEAVLVAHPGVAEAAVFGRPDPEWGEAVTALVVPRDRAPRSTPASCARFCAERLARASRSRRRSSSSPRCRGPTSGKLPPRPTCASVRVAMAACADDVPHGESRDALGRAGGRAGRRARDSLRADHDAGVGLDGRRDRPAAGPHRARARRRHRRHGFLAAELIQPGGTLICSDFAPEMLTRARSGAPRSWASRNVALPADRRRVASTSRPRASTACCAAGATC